MKTIIKLACIALILASGTSFFKVKAEIDYSYEYQWRSIPPEGADTLEVYLSYLYYTDLETVRPQLKKKSLPSKVYVKDDSIYFNIVDIPCPKKRDPAGGSYFSFEHYYGWMKGIVEDNKIKFSNEEILADITTTIQEPDSQEPDSINISSENTQIKLYAISEIGVFESNYRSTSTDFSNSYSIPLELSGEDITGDFHKDTDLIYNLNGGFLASQKELEYIASGYYDYGYGDGYHYACITIQLIPDLLTGHISEAEPDSLPTPILSHINEIYNAHSFGMLMDTQIPKIDVRLNIVTPDNLLINPKKLFIRLWVDDEDYGTLSFNEYGNPFMHGFFYGIALPENMYPDNYAPQVRAYCYYLKEDGTEVISPGASLNCPSDVALQWAKNPCEFTTPGNDVTYDLTGRQVKGDNLSPGIYIRNGRKFIISR